VTGRERGSGAGRQAGKPQTKFTRGLRFRLTAGYALFFTLVLVGAGLVFRQTLAASLDKQAHDLLEQEWAALKGYLRIERRRPLWFYDRNDPDEAFIVGRLQRVYLLTDARGNVLESSELYRALGIDPPAEVRAMIRAAGLQRPIWRVRQNRQGGAFLIRGGVVYDERGRQPYYVAIGRPLAENSAILEQYTWRYLSVIPLMIASGCVLGWFLAGRALMPVTGIAQAAQRISGSNLKLRIPTRGAGDELDYLIETFNEMIERLDQSFRQIRQFSTDVSHELRTPITAIRGQLEVALFNAETAEQHREAIQNALEDVERLSQLVRALLLLSQAESGQVALQKSPLNLAAVVREIVDQFQILAEAAHIHLTANLPAECPAELDRIQIERMISNLLSNALKFTPAGGEVRVSLWQENGRAQLVVEDTGHGIAQEKLPFIFDRFYRVAGAESAGAPERGLGLGLSFVAWIVKAHAGTITVASNPGQGSRFSVSLPASRVLEAPRPAPAADVPAVRV
jgi:heavy metal sensor kinase